MTYGNLWNRVMERMQAKRPEVGMGATMCHFSDRSACTIVAVKLYTQGPKTGNIKEIHVQRDKARRTDKNGMSESQTYEYSADPGAPVEVFRLTQKGWRNKNKEGLLVGHRDEYYDFSF